MVKVQINDKCIYYDGWLRSVLDDIKEGRLGQDNDCLIVLDGETGSGKSTIAQQMAYYLDPTFNLDRVCFEVDDFMEKMYNAKKKQAVIFDEATGGLNIKRTMSSIVLNLVQFLTEARGLNLFIILVLPSIFDLDKSVAVQRATCLVHVGLNSKGKRGYFRFFGKQKKNNLLNNENCRKTRMYKVAHTFQGRFVGGYVVDEKLYRQKKQDMLKRFFGRNKNSGVCYNRTVTNKELFLKEGEEYFNLLKSGKTYEDIMQTGVSRMTITNRINLYKKQLYVSNSYNGTSISLPSLEVSGRKYE